MTNCLKTLLNSIVNNDNLPFFNALKIRKYAEETFSNSRRIRVRVTSATTAVCKTGYFVNTSGTNIGTILDLPIGETRIYLGTPEAEFLINNKYVLTELEIQGSSYIDDFSEVTYLPLTRCHVPGAGNIKSLNKLVNCNNILISSRPTTQSATGDLSDLSSLVNLTNIGFSAYGSAEAITGNIADMSNFPLLTRWEVPGTKISGSIESFVKACINKTTPKTSGTINMGYKNNLVTFNGSPVANNKSFSWEPNATAGRTDITYDGTTITIDNTTGNIVS